MADSMISVDEFRGQAQRWLGANLVRRAPDEERGARGLTHRTVEDIARQRLLQKQLFEAGYAGIAWPEMYGGRGLSAAHEAAFEAEAASYVMPDLGIAGVVTIKVCGAAILQHAAHELKARHLPRMLAGDELWVEFLSEESAGSDLAGITTTAVSDGDSWVLDGVKIWSSGAYYADYGLCLARTDWDVPKHRGLTWFGVSTAQPGVTVEPLREITGDVEFCKETFRHVVVPDTERIGEVGEGWRIAQTVLQHERDASSGSLTTSEMPRGPGPLPADLVELARRAGRDDDRHVRQLIARAHTDDFALRALGARLADLMAAGHPAGAGLVSYSKLAAGVIEPRRARAAMEIGAEAAVAWADGDRDGLTFALDYLNCRVTSIAGGTNEIQRNALGERVLGLPREPSFDRTKSFRQVQDEAAGWTGQA